ncbi:MAG: Arm DNA-binding domain-containing protein [Desulfotomaculales bacterium]
MAKRGHGEGTIVKHKKTGKWMAQASIGYDPATGKLKRITKYFETRKEARTGWRRWPTRRILVLLWNRIR